MQIITIVLFVIVFLLMAILFELMKSVKSDLIEDIKSLNDKRIEDKFLLRRLMITLFKNRNQENGKSKNTPGNN